VAENKEKMLNKQVEIHNLDKKLNKDREKAYISDNKVLKDENEEINAKLCDMHKLQNKLNVQ